MQEKVSECGFVFEKFLIDQSEEKILLINQ